jgi:transposase-like protein
MQDRRQEDRPEGGGAEASPQIPIRPTGAPTASSAERTLEAALLEGLETLEPIDAPEVVPPEVEATLLSVWRRLLREGGGPALTLAEAATLLGTSVESVRKRIKAGQIRAFHDERGRVRIVATLEPPPGESFPEVVTEREAADILRLREELKSLRRELDELLGERQELAKELEATREALRRANDEIEAMWRVLSARNLAARRASGAQLDRSRIRWQISQARNLARRPKWPWLRAS